MQVHCAGWLMTRKSLTDCSANQNTEYHKKTILIGSSDFMAAKAGVRQITVGYSLLTTVLSTAATCSINFTAAIIAFAYPHNMKVSKVQAEKINAIFEKFDKVMPYTEKQFVDNICR